MEHRTSKTHLEFDFARAEKTYSKTNEVLRGQQITSPYDLYSVERLRDVHKLRRGMAFATDIFVFGMGGPKDRRVTKVSGLPYWPKGREWPTTSDGSRCQFLGQVCFLDSRDIVGNLPGDILLIFIPPNEEDWFGEIEPVRLEWVTVAEQRLIERFPRGVRPYSKSEWYGVLHRTYDYPDVMEQAEKLNVRSTKDLPVLNGTKIGGLPHTIQSKVKYTVDSRTGLPMVLLDKKRTTVPRRFLCQIGSIQPAPFVPYPWTNRRKKLTLASDNSGIYGDDNECVFGDMGSIYVFMDPSRKCFATFECY